MPKYQVEMKDGRKLIVEADQPPTEQEVMEHLRGSPRTSEQFAPPTDKMGAFMSGVGAGVGPGPNTVDFIKRGAKELGGQIMGAPAAVKQMVTHPVDTVMGMPGAIAKRAGEYMDDPLGTIYDKPASFLEDAAGVAGAAEVGVRGAAAAGRGAGRMARAAGRSPIAQGAKAVAAGAIEDTPILGGAIKGYKTFQNARKTAEKAGSGRLAGAAPNLEDTLNDTLQGMLGEEEAAGKVTLPPSDRPTMTPGGQPAVSGARYDEMSAALDEASAGVPERGMILDEEGRPLAEAESPMDPHYAEYRASRQRSGNTFKTPAEADVRNAALDNPTFEPSVEPEVPQSMMQGPARPEQPAPTPAPMMEPAYAGAADEPIGERFMSMDDPDLPRPGSGAEAFRDTAPPEKWHSGADPGTPEARRMSASHREEALADEMYRQLIDDPRK